MDTDVSSSVWSLLPNELLWRVFSFLSRKKKWKSQASALSLVNKHWYDAIRGYKTTLKPKNDTPFSLTRNIETVFRFKNLETIVIDDAPSDDDSEVNAERLPYLDCLRRVKLSNSRVDVVAALLSNAPRLTHLSLDHPQCLLPVVWQCLKRQTSLLWLQLVGKLDVPSKDLTSMKLTQLERLDVCYLGMQPNSLTLMIGCSRRLKVLRVRVDCLSALDMETLHGLKDLTSLTLEGILENDVFVPSLLPRLKHLSFSCQRPPVLLGISSELTALGLEIWDKIENQETIDGLCTLISRLTALEISLPACDPTTISEILSHGQEMQRLKIKNYLLTRTDVDHLMRLRELDVLVTMQTHPRQRDELLQNISWLSHITCLKIDLTDPSDLCELLYTDNEQPMQLSKLVVNHVTYCAVPPIFVSGQKVRDLRLSRWKFDASVFTEEWPWSFHLLRNLCFTECTWKTALREELRQLLNWEPLKHLRHLALPRECFQPNNVELIEALREKAPEVIIDDNPDWSTRDFTM